MKNNLAGSVCANVGPFLQFFILLPIKDLALGMSGFILNLFFYYFIIDIEMVVATFNKGMKHNGGIKVA